MSPSYTSLRCFEDIVSITSLKLNSKCYGICIGIHFKLFILLQYIPWYALGFPIVKQVKSARRNLYFVL